MNLTIELDESLLAKAKGLIRRDLSEQQLVELALQTFIRVESGKRLAEMGGTLPGAEHLPRRNREPE